VGRYHDSGCGHAVTRLCVTVLGGHVLAVVRDPVPVLVAFVKDVTSFRVLVKNADCAPRNWQRSYTAPVRHDFQKDRPPRDGDAVDNVRFGRTSVAGATPLARTRLFCWTLQHRTGYTVVNVALRTGAVDARRRCYEGACRTLFYVNVVRVDTTGGLHEHAHATAVSTFTVRWRCVVL